MREGLERIDWDAYAAEYDIGTIQMSRPYRRLVDRVVAEYRKLVLPEHPVVADFGVGTGNFLLPLTVLSHGGTFHGLDLFENFLTLVREKAGGFRGDIRATRWDVREPFFEDGSIDVALVVHVANTLEEPLRVYANAARALKPGGYLITSDIGRVIEPRDWIGPLIGGSLRDHGFLRTLGYLWRTRTFRRVNRVASERQRRALSYLHTLERFRADLSDLGYEILVTGVEYNGVDDFAVARKPVGGP
jgi:SAM-dependent methyltransferase